MSVPSLKFEILDSVAWLTLNRPDQLNALTAEMHQGLRDALDQIESDEDCRCVVITGAGRGFCAGQDLSERRVSEGAAPVDIGETLARDLHPLVWKLQCLRIPVVVAVNGVAAGAGVSLALCGDIVIAGRSAKFSTAFARVGLGPDGGLSWRLPRLIGHARASALMLLSGSLNGEEAERVGLIWRCVDDAALADETRAIVARLLEQPRAALCLTRSLLQSGADTSLYDQLEAERSFQATLGSRPDYQEGLAAFFEKRPPRFRR